MIAVKISSRRNGRTFEQDKEICKELEKGDSIAFMGLKTQEEAQKVADRLFSNHGILTEFTPMHVTPLPKPIFDIKDPETPIIGYEYLPPRLTGYLFKKKITS